jgi:hypothetical protein
MKQGQQVGLSLSKMATCAPPPRDEPSETPSSAWACRPRPKGSFTLWRSRAFRSMNSLSGRCDSSYGRKPPGVGSPGSPGRCCHQPCTAARRDFRWRSPYKGKTAARPEAHIPSHHLRRRRTRLGFRTSSPECRERRPGGKRKGRPPVGVSIWRARKIATAGVGFLVDKGTGQGKNRRRKVPSRLRPPLRGSAAAGRATGTAACSDESAAKGNRDVVGESVNQAVPARAC